MAPIGMHPQVCNAMFDLHSFRHELSVYFVKYLREPSSEKKQFLLKIKKKDEWVKLPNPNLHLWAVFSQ